MAHFFTPADSLFLYKDKSEETIEKYIKAHHAVYDEMRATGAAPSGENADFINEVHSKTSLQEQILLDMRLMAHPRSRANVHEYVGYWLEAYVEAMIVADMGADLASRANARDFVARFPDTLFGYARAHFDAALMARLNFLSRGFSLESSSSSPSAAGNSGGPIDPMLLGLDNPGFNASPYASSSSASPAPGTFLASQANSFAVPPASSASPQEEGIIPAATNPWDKSINWAGDVYVAAK